MPYAIMIPPVQKGSDKTEAVYSPNISSTKEKNKYEHSHYSIFLKLLQLAFLFPITGK
jgi:hypothetical protein